jgi:bifunctional non-homologous end joining protein LigD
MGTARVSDGATIGGVEISNVNKVWWPDEGITKGDIARFYHAISAVLLPWMRDRPLTAERCPDGMLGGCFYRKNFPEGNIPVGPRLRLRAASTGKDVNYVVGGTLGVLLGLVRVGCIAVHIMNSRVGSMHDADWLAFDLDPSSGEFSDTIRAGKALRVILDEHGLVSFPKTSGSRGLHVFVPLRSGHSQEDVTAFAVRVGDELARREPDLVTMAHRKSERGSRVYADPFRNAYLQTIVAPFSVRRRPGATISTPLAWDEVTARLDPRRFTIKTIERRIATADPWADFRKRAQKLPD